MMGYTRHRANRSAWHSGWSSSRRPAVGAFSASTARLVEKPASLGDPERVHIKGAEQSPRRPATAGRPDQMILPLGPYRLWSVASGRWPPSRACCGVRWRGHGAVVSGRVPRASARAVSCERPPPWLLGRRWFLAYCESTPPGAAQHRGGSAISHRRRES